jgi:hypothetical protein
MTDLAFPDASSISVDEAAILLGTTVPRVLLLMRSGALEGTCVDGVWHINTTSLGTCPSPQAMPHHKGGCGSCHGCAG